MRPAMPAPLTAFLLTSTSASLVIIFVNTSLKKQIVEKNFISYFLINNGSIFYSAIDPVCENGAEFDYAMTNSNLHIC
jgi:hypothetical protein